MKLKKKFKKPKQVESLAIDSERCTGCGKCVKRCKREVFSLSKKGKYAVVSQLEACVGCGKCVKKMCSKGAIHLQLVKSK